MTKDEKKRLHKLMRFNAFLMFIMFFIMTPYIVSLREDVENAEFDESVAKISLQQKIEHIDKLYHIIDSLKKPIIVVETPKEKKPHKKEVREIKDTLKTTSDTLSIDTISNPIDTISN